MKRLLLAAGLALAAPPAFAQAARDNLDSLRTFPTVFTPSAGHTGITFKGLTRDVVIRVFNVTGEHVATLRKNDDTDALFWATVVNDQTTPLAAGVYLYIAVSPGHPVRRGKFIVLR